MKAKIKQTGEIIEVENLYDDGTALVGDMFYKVSELDFDSVIDWEKVRIKAAISALQGFAASPQIASTDTLARWSVCAADTLIAELKKGGLNYEHDSTRID